MLYVVYCTTSNTPKHEANFTLFTTQHALAPYILKIDPN